MMKRIVALIAMLIFAGAAQAAAPTGEQKAEFYRVCYGISQDEALCTCKAEAAMDLIDSDFMAVVIDAMKGATPADSAYIAYNDYIARSNQACKPNY